MKILDQLTGLGAFVASGGADFQNTCFTWEPGDDADPVTFDIAVKKEASVADFEYINMQDRDNPDRSVMARSVHRMVRIRSVNGEVAEQDQLTLEECNRLKPSLLLAFFIAIGELKKPEGKPKPRARTKKT